MLHRGLATLSKAILARDPQSRHQARYELVDSLARRLGLRTYHRNLAWVNDEDYVRAWQQFRPGNTVVKDRKFILHSIARSLAPMPGDTAECGVFDGGSSFLMCLAREGTAGRQHHVFDSFQGLSQPADVDAPADPTAYEWQEHDLAVPLEAVQAKLGRFDFVHYHPGWIPERFPDVSDRRFSFVHVDVDLYQPTRDAVSFFYERMVPGGVILCDDYGSTLCPGAKQAFDEVISDTPERRVIHLTTGQGMLIKAP